MTTEPWTRCASCDATTDKTFGSMYVPNFYACDVDCAARFMADIAGLRFRHAVEREELTHG